MGVRDRLAQLRKVFGTSVPGAIQAAEAAAHMTPQSPFSPGEPIGPYDGYSRTPRSHDFVTGYNIASRPRTHERVAFDTLRGLVEAYDVAQACIWHRIDSIRSLDWSLIPAQGHQGDVADIIPIGLGALTKPDRDQPFATWLSSYLYDVLAYDAGTLYRMRNRRGDAIGLRVVDGTTIAPLLDYWGDPPQDPAPAFVQYAQGLPWNWLTRDDLIYVPFRKRSNSPYGTAPLETILLNANTDLRFQQYFLQRFTEGNIPEAFASAPEGWSPDQIEQWQELWDSFMLGDQARKSQIRWIPGGSTIAWSNEKDFTDTFSLFLMRKTCAAFHVVPSDLGFTETVNLSSSESQADVQHRVGDLPLIRHVQGILTSFLQDDLGLPLQFAFDLGEEQTDRLQQAQADQIYIQMGAISPSDVREMRYGLPEPDGIPVPRFVFSTRSGPIPLSALYGVAGKIDPETAAPAPDAPLPHTVFTGVAGTEPNPPVVGPPLAEQLYGPGALPPGYTDPLAPVGKDATAGITAETGITGYDLAGHDEDEGEDEDESDGEQVRKELAAFRAFRKARRRDGRWRDFEFRHVDPQVARQLNDDARATIGKAADPKGQAPDGANWPGWKLDLAAAAYWAPLIAAVVAAAFPAGRAQQLADAYAGQQPQQSGEQPTKTEATAAALAWLTSQDIDLVAPLTPVLTGLVTDAYLIGTASAQAVTGGGRAQVGAWKPGDTKAARAQIEVLGASAGLAAVLDGIQHVASRVANAQLKDLARALGGGTAAGDKPSDVAEAMRQAAADPGRAQGVAVTEITRASGVAALDTYRQSEVAVGRWLTEEDVKVCPICDANAAAGRVPIGDPYPSSDTTPPAHPNCRCALLPA